MQNKKFKNRDVSPELHPPASEPTHEQLPKHTHNKIILNIQRISSASLIPETGAAGPVIPAAQDKPPGSMGKETWENM